MVSFHSDSHAVQDADLACADLALSCDLRSAQRICYRPGKARVSLYPRRESARGKSLDTKVRRVVTEILLS
jgi:hypothetical protein